MLKDVFFGTFGGLALFLYGMTLMSEGLKKVAGQRLKSILESMTKRKVVGGLVGAGVTALVQSSSATTVMIIGFINAGLLTLSQAIPVIIGTNVGTTATAWLVSISGLHFFKISAYSLPSVAIGIILQYFAKSRTTKDFGQILLGFGILFIGIGFMKDAFSGLRESDAITQIFMRSAEQPILALLAGIIITMLVQSSSASIASVQILAASGAFGNDYSLALVIAIPFILGSNIGTTITAQLAAIGTNTNARRAAMAHTMFNVLSTLICFWFIRQMGAITELVSPWELSATTVALSIAISHSAVNVLGAFVFLPMSNVLARIVTFIIKDKETPEEGIVVLEEHLLDTPVLALEQSRREITRMAQKAKLAMSDSISGLIYDDKSKFDAVYKMEDTIDHFQNEITSYLIELSRRRLSDQVSIELPVLLHTVNDLERAGDHAVNIVELGERKRKSKITFSDAAVKESEELFVQINSMFDNIIESLSHDNKEAAKLAMENEKTINKMQIQFRRTHVKRMAENECSAEKSLIFVDLVDNIEKVGDHLSNIAQAVIGGLHWEDAQI